MTVHAIFRSGLRHPLTLGAAAMFMLLTAAYSFSAGLRATRGASITGDEPFYLLTTQSLLQDGNLDLTRQYADETYRSFFDHPDGLWKQSVPVNGRLLSPHEPGLSVLLVPGFAIAGLVGAQAELLLLAVATFALSFVLVALETGAARLSWFTVAAVGLAAPGFVYATEIYPEMPAALCIILALLVVRTCPGGVAAAVALAAFLAALAWLGMKYVPLGAVIAAAYLWRAPGKPRAAFLCVGGLAAATYGWFHLSLYDSWTAYSSNTVYEGASTGAVLDSHLAFDGRSYRIWGLFIDRRFGIGRWAPIFLAVLPSLPLLLRAGTIGRVVAALIAVAVAMASFVAITMMGWWFPGRMLIVVYPLFALVLALTWRAAAPWLRAAGVALAGYSVAVTAALAYAARSGEVTIAVDPFDMGAWFFRAAGPLFPRYTSWGAETQLLNAAWLVAGLGAMALAGRAAVSGRGFSKQRSREPATVTTPVRHRGSFMDIRKRGKIDALQQ